VAGAILSTRWGDTWIEVGHEIMEITEDLEHDSRTLPMLL